MALVWRKKRIWLVGSFASDKRIVEDSPTGVVRKDWQFSWSICVDFSDCLPVPAPKPTFRIRLRIRSNSARKRLAREKAAPRARGRFPFGRLFVPRRVKSFTGNNWGAPRERPRRAAGAWHTIHRSPWRCCGSQTARVRSWRSPTPRSSAPPTPTSSRTPSSAIWSSSRGPIPRLSPGRSRSTACSENSSACPPGTPCGSSRSRRPCPSSTRRA